jgi:ferredoxin
MFNALSRRVYGRGSIVMAKITVIREKTFDAKSDKRLVLALEDNGIDILHRCGGNARCTTCRVIFHAGEPDRMTEAERNRLQQNLLIGKVRLSCQILCDHDMTIEPVYRLHDTDYDSPGDRPADHITPNPVWVPVPR